MRFDHAHGATDALAIGGFFETDSNSPRDVEQSVRASFLRQIHPWEKSTGTSAIVRVVADGKSGTGEDRRCNSLAQISLEMEHRGATMKAGQAWYQFNL